VHHSARALGSNALRAVVRWNRVSRSIGQQHFPNKISVHIVQVRFVSIKTKEAS